VFDTPARLIERVPPSYPDDAKQAGMEGTVEMDVLIDEKGKVVRVSVTRAVPRLNDAAVTCVREWRFEPGRLSGRAIPTVTRVPLSFRLR
jgi:protein TonB